MSLITKYLSPGSECLLNVNNKFQKPPLWAEMLRRNPKKRKETFQECVLFIYFPYNHQKAHPKKDTHKTIGKFGDFCHHMTALR